MNFFWMWGMYHLAYILAVVLSVACALILKYTERSAAQLCTSGANVSWALKDIFWMLENGKVLPSGLTWASGFFVITLTCTALAFILGDVAGTLDAVLSRLRRVRSIFVG